MGEILIVAGQNFNHAETQTPTATAEQDLYFMRTDAPNVLKMGRKLSILERQACLVLKGSPNT